MHFYAIGNIFTGFNFVGPFKDCAAAEAAAENERSSGLVEAYFVGELTPAAEEPCLCGELGPHWICGVRDPKAQIELEQRALAIASQLGVPYDTEALDTDMTAQENFIHDVVLLMEEHGFTGWTPEKGFE